MIQTIYIEHGTKKYPLIITPLDDPELKDEEGAIHVRCDVANLNQGYYIEDLGGLIEMLPELIEEAKNIKERESLLKVRISQKEKSLLENYAKQSGYKNLSSYVRAKLLQTK